MCNFRKFVYNIINKKKRLVIILIQIRPVSDLQNDYNAIEKAILENEQRVYLTKNGYGSMVIMNLEEYSRMTEPNLNVNANLSDVNNVKKEHVEIISRPKKVVDEDDE